MPHDQGGSVPPDVHWEKKLESAQNVIFCKELFQQVHLSSLFVHVAIILVLYV